MSRTICLCVVAFVVGLPSLCYAQPAAEAPGKEPSSPAAKAEAISKQLSADLREAREELRKIPDKQTRERLELLLGRAELKVNDLQRELAATTASTRPAAASAADFAKVLKGIKAESFDAGKVAFIEGLGKTRHYTSAQLREMLATFSFDDGRGKVAILLHPLLVDPENFFTALEVFSFDAGRKAVMEKVKVK